jgi:hypothetical protein
MKRILLTASAILLGTAFAFSQSLKIMTVGGNHSLNDSTIIVNGSLPTLAFALSLDVKNTSAGSIITKVKRIDTIVAAHSSNSVCWGPSCYGVQTGYEWTTPASETVASGVKDTTFSSHYNDSNHAGTSLIRYTFYNINNPTDSSWVLVKYVIAPLGIPEVSVDNLHLSAAYPNPANSTVSFNYHMNGVQQAKFELYNALGQCVQTIPVNSSIDKLNVNVSTLPAGIYICKLEANGSQPVFQKLIVTH